MHHRARLRLASNESCEQHGNNINIYGAKDGVYKSIPQTLDELQNNIQEEIANISEAELQHVNQNVFRRYNARLAANGEHFQHFLWKDNHI